MGYHRAGALSMLGSWDPFPDQASLHRHPVREWELGVRCGEGRPQPAAREFCVYFPFSIFPFVSFRFSFPQRMDFGHRDTAGRVCRQVGKNNQAPVRFPRATGNNHHNQPHCKCKIHPPRPHGAPYRHTAYRTVHNTTANNKKKTAHHQLTALLWPNQHGVLSGHALI